MVFSPFFLPGDLAYMRAMQKLFIDNPRNNGTAGDTCVIRRPVRTSDGLGGWTETFSQQTGVPCRLWISSGPNGTTQQTGYWAEQEQRRTSAFMIFYWDADVRIGDYLVYTNNETSFTAEYRCVGLQDDDTMNTATRIRVERVGA